MTAVTKSHAVCDLRALILVSLLRRAECLCFGFDRELFSTPGQNREHIWNVTTVTYLRDVLRLISKLFIFSVRSWGWHITSRSLKTV